MRLTIRAVVGASAVLAFGPVSHAAAADYPAAGGGCSSGWCVNKTFPLIVGRYPQPCCSPKLASGTCYGHFQTQWTPWATACPTWSESPPPLNTVPPVYNVAPAPVPAGQPRTPTPPKEPVPQSKDVPPPAESSPKPPAVSVTPKVSVPEVPGKLDERGLILPPVPEIPVSTPPRF